MPEPLHNLEELSVNGSRLGALPPPLRRQEEFPQHGSPLSRQRLQEPATPEERTPNRETPELSSAQKLKRDMDMIVQRDEQRVAMVAAEKGSKAKNVNRVGKSVPKEEGPSGKKGRKTRYAADAASNM